MKKTFRLLGVISLMLIIGFTVISCGGNSPSSVVRQLHTAIEKEDANKVNQLMVPEAASMVVMMMEKLKGGLEEYGKITKTEEEIDGDRAVVYVTYSNGEEDEFVLVKVDGKWKVTIEK